MHATTSNSTGNTESPPDATEIDESHKDLLEEDDHVREIHPGQFFLPLL